MHQLFNDYRRYVAKIGGGILRSHSEVDDLVQDVFLATHEDLHTLRDPSCTKAWLATITVRLAHRNLRQRVLQRRIGEIEPYSLALMNSVALTSDDQADFNGTAARLRKLPGRLRTPWMLKHLAGESLPTIAERCNCSESTAQRRIQSATRLLVQQDADDRSAQLRAAPSTRPEPRSPVNAPRSAGAGSFAATTTDHGPPRARVERQG